MNKGRGEAARRYAEDAESKFDQIYTAFRSVQPPKRNPKRHNPSSLQHWKITCRGIRWVFARSSVILMFLGFLVAILNDLWWGPQPHTLPFLECRFSVVGPIRQRLLKLFQDFISRDQPLGQIPLRMPQSKQFPKDQSGFSSLLHYFFSFLSQSIQSHLHPSS